jgi:hypothetical protein
METYYKPEHLAKFEEIGKELSGLAEKFFDYYNAVFQEGALTEREKSLTALAPAHTVQWPYCSMPLLRRVWRRALMWRR